VIQRYRKLRGPIGGSLHSLCNSGVPLGLYERSSNCLYQELSLLFLCESFPRWLLDTRWQSICHEFTIAHSTFSFAGFCFVLKTRAEITST
jgi:hypothetical protein